MQITLSIPRLVQGVHKPPALTYSYIQTRQENVYRRCAVPAFSPSSDRLFTVIAYGSQTFHCHNLGTPSHADGPDIKTASHPRISSAQLVSHSFTNTLYQTRHSLRPNLLILTQCTSLTPPSLPLLPPSSRPRTSPPSLTT